TSPWLGRISPIKVFRITVLPQPLSPMMPTVCPCATARSISRSTGLRPKLTSTPRISMSAPEDDLRPDLSVTATMCVGGLEQPRSLGPDQQIEVVECDPQKEIQHQNQHERDDESAGGRSAHAFGAGIAMKAAVATDQRNRRAEKQAFEDAGENVVGADEVLRV